MKLLKIISVVGARPNFIKIAPFCREVGKVRDRIEHILVHTGQHYDYEMSLEFFESLSIPKPDIQLGVGSASHAVQTANIMIEFEKICLSEKPDWVVVVGDVNTTMACALVARKLNVKVAHIEAGLRSFDINMPEEVNRKVTDSITDLLFTHSIDADENLKKEGIDGRKIRMVGNIMIDTLVNEMDKANTRRTYEKWDLKPKKFVYVTLHRPSNVDSPDLLESILDNLTKIADRLPVVFPLHPRTLKRIEEFDLKGKIEDADGFIATTPVSYHDSICLAKNARFVLTDSGGLQEETTYLGTRCLTLRPNTERPVTIAQGTNKLTSVDKMIEDMENLLVEEDTGGFNDPPPLWDGQTATRIVEVFLE